jgi:ribosomal protein S27AE
MSNEDIVLVGDPCPQCGGTIWILNKHKGTTFCRNCGYVTADLKTPIVKMNGG